MNSLAQTTPASSKCWQLWLVNPIWEHSSRELSFPLHSTLSSQMIPDPDANEALLVNENADFNPSIRHATSASSKSHKSSQTVPHPPELRLISTRPSILEARLVPLSRIARVGTIHKAVCVCVCVCVCVREREWEDASSNCIYIALNVSMSFKYLGRPLQHLHRGHSCSVETLHMDGFHIDTHRWSFPLHCTSHHPARCYQFQDRNWRNKQNDNTQGNNYYGS